MTLKSFPRGGKNVAEEKQLKSKLYESDEKPKKTSKNQKEKAQRIKKELELNLITDTADRLTYKTIQEGITILGCVFDVTEYHLIVSLPGGIVGYVQATDVSESYTNMIQNLVKSENNQIDEFKSLTELYSPGDYVVGYVEEIRLGEKLAVKLSLEPRLINQNLNVNSLEKGSKMVCSISSVNDHGCVIDTGVSNVRAFLPDQQNNDEQCLFPGKQLLCSVQEIQTSENTSTIKLSAKHKHVKAVEEIQIKSLDSVMPGTKFNLHVKKVLSNGLCVSFGENYIGYVNQLYLDDPLSKYSEGTEVTGTLLYVIPTVKLVHFSLRLNKKLKDNIKPGDIVEEATALFRESGGIVLQLTKSGVRGFVPLKKLNCDGKLVPEKFAPGSKHKCKILTYNRMDCTYVCSMEQSTFAQKYFTLSEFQPGDMVTVTIAKIDLEALYVNVKYGNVNGHVPSEHVSDLGVSGIKKLKENQDVRSRVLAIDKEHNKVYFTLKKSLMESKYPVLSDIRQAKIDAKYHGTIIQKKNKGFLVKFFGNVKGFLPESLINKKAFHDSLNLSIGQTILVTVRTVHESSGKMILDIATEEMQKKVSGFAIGEQVEGTIIDSSTQGVYLEITKNDGDIVVKGYLPAGHISCCTEIASLLASRCIPGDTLSALVFSTEPSLLLTRTLLPREEYRQFDQLKRGDCIPCTVKDIEENGVRVILPITGGLPFGYVPYNNVSHIDMLYKHNMLFAKVTYIHKDHLSLSMSLKEIYDGLTDTASRTAAAVDTLVLYFNKLAELANYPHYESRPISKVKLGQRITGKIDKITGDGLVIELPDNLLGIVSKDHYSGEVKVGDTVSATVMWKNYVHELVELTMLPIVMNRINAKQNNVLDVPSEQIIRGRILMVTSWFVLVVLKGSGQGSLAALPVRRHMNDLRPDLSPYTVHAKIRCYAILKSNDCDIIPICMVKSAFEEQSSTAGKRKSSEENGEVPSKKIQTEKGKGLKTGKQSEVEVQKRKKAMKSVTVPECGFFWDDQPNPGLLEKEEEEEESSNDSEDETEEQPRRKKKKLSAAERREEEKQKEREIRQREEALAGNQLPNSVDQFDRLVLASPDSSIVWLQYMAYHLQATEIEKARAVARRAVKTINFREENERLNVWNAWLNLESKFGTADSLNDVFQEAVRTNDSLKVYKHMLTVHVEAGRQAELEKTVNTMISKFKQNSDVWIECGTAFLKIGLNDKCKNLMHRALQSLPPPKHVNLVAKFALLESKFGDKERAQTLFEHALVSYPKRVDIWSCYVDSLVKTNDIDLARKVLERAVVQTLPAKKMKVLLKKFVHFEEQHGTPQNVARVQAMCVEFVEKLSIKRS